MIFVFKKYSNDLSAWQPYLQVDQYMSPKSVW